MAEPAIRILIADDHPIFRDGLRKLLEAEPGFQIVGEAADGEEALTLVNQLHPDVLLLDVTMPKLPGLATLKELADAGHPTRAILLTAAIEKPEIVTALQLGARGVVMKDAATRLLFKSIRCVMDGQYWVGREAVADLVDTLRTLAPEPKADKRKKFGLTKRELEVLTEIVSGYTNKEIAQKLTLSEDTVKHHVTNIFNKLGVSNRLELALYAVHHQLVDSA